SAARARGEMRGGPATEAETFVAVAFPDSEVQILPYHRTVKDLAGHTPGQFLDVMKSRWSVAPGPPVPRRKGEVSMYLAGAWYVVDIGQAAPEDGSRASGLDVALLQRHVLEGLLGIGDIRTDKRVYFVGGAR